VSAQTFGRGCYTVESRENIAGGRVVYAVEAGLDEHRPNDLPLVSSVGVLIRNCGGVEGQGANPHLVVRRVRPVRVANGERI
jgi:hypothetical protein